MVRIIFFAILMNCAQGWASDMSSRLWSQVKQDYAGFYQFSTLHQLTPSLVVGGVMANSQLDSWFHSELGVSHHKDDDWVESLNDIGDVSRTFPALPIYLTIYGIDSYVNTEPGLLGEWANYSFRSFIVGAPAALATAHLTGGGRPEEGSSDWHFLDDNNSVSGHSFSGAIPFVNAAMMSQSIWYKAGWYGASVLPAVARVYKDKHYASQAFLGWTFAFVSAKVVQGQSNSSTVSLGYVYDAPVLTYRKIF